MELLLNIKGLFRDQQELRDMVRKRKICYDHEPYYITTKKGELIQIGFQINLYATLPENVEDRTADSAEYGGVERDVTLLAEALSNTCDPIHMCESTTIEPGRITYSPDRKMRPDVTVHIPVFDQNNFGHPVDDSVRNAFHMGIKLIESAGVQKIRWQD
ncbi:MAG: hypothetical protein HZA17_08755 [Nitrospirae bacterium]|nr:hypothetical protein [Nitrospirota bacterium]